MRLLNTTTLEVESVTTKTSYVILSHTWGKEEVSFQDIQDLNRARTMAGFDKVFSSATLAKELGYNYIWIDTCNIDKTSSAELSEAINCRTAVQLTVNLFLTAEQQCTDGTKRQTSAWCICLMYRHFPRTGQMT
jgi:hypothetical protein